MIARVWRCSADRDKAPHYVEHFTHSVLPELNALGGFEGAYLMQRDLGDGVEITVMTLWASMEAIRGFAGDQVEVAVVAPAAQAVLRSYETTVTHSQVVVDTRSTSTN